MIYLIAMQHSMKSSASDNSSRPRAIRLNISKIRQSFIFWIIAIAQRSGFEYCVLTAALKWLFCLIQIRSVIRYLEMLSLLKHWFCHNISLNVITPPPFKCFFVSSFYIQAIISNIVDTEKMIFFLQN